MSPSTEIRSLVVMCRRLDRPRGGAALRNWQNVHGLSKLGPVDVISVGPSDPPMMVDGVRHYEHIAKDVRTNLARKFMNRRWVLAPTAHPAVNALYQNSAVMAINRRLKSVGYDVAVVEELGLAKYLKDLNHSSCLTIFDAHNVESELGGEIAASRHASGEASRLAIWKRNRLEYQLAASEKHFALASNRVWACSTADRQGLANLIGDTHPIDIIPNSIDVASYAQDDRLHEADDWRAEPMLLTYLGAYSYFPNEQAALQLINEVLPCLEKLGVSASLQLIGAGPTPAMKLAAAGRKNVLITGQVDSILPYLKRRCLVVLPIRLGGGTRLKILEAFAACRPVISTPKGVEGIDAIDGHHLVVRESCHDLAAAAITLWNDPDLRSSLCRNALHLVTEYHSLESTGNLIRASVMKTISSARR